MFGSSRAFGSSACVSGSWKRSTWDWAILTGRPPGGPNGALGNRRNIKTIAPWRIGATGDAAESIRFVANASRGFKPLLYNDGVTFQAGVDAAGTFDASYAARVRPGGGFDPCLPRNLFISLGWRG